MIRRAVAVLLAALSPAPLGAQGLLYEGGVSVATGSYIFAPRTTSGVVSTGISVGSSRVTLRASLPVYFQNTTLVSLSGPGGRLPTGGSSSGVVADSGAARKGRQNGGGGPAMMVSAATGTAADVDVPSSAVTGYESAVGDPTMQASWRAIDQGGTAVTASAFAKAPVADTATFGTGEWDVGGGIGIARWFGRSLVLGLDVAYSHLGDMPALDFQNPVAGTASVTYYSSSDWGLGVSASGSTSALEGYDGPAWIGAHVVRGTGPAGWGLSAAVGLTETTPDVSVGLTWRVRLAK